MRKTKLYMVGFDDDNQTIYGKDEQALHRFADPFTMAQAKRHVQAIYKTYRGADPLMTIYKLVPVRDKP